MIIGGLQDSYGPETIFNHQCPLTFDLLTPKSIGYILDSWGASVWSFMIIGGLQSQWLSGNHFNHQCPMTLTFDLWTPKLIEHILELMTQLWSGNHLQLTMPHDLDLWPFDLKIIRAYPWLMGSKCMKFHCYIKRYLTNSPETNCWHPPARPPAQRTADYSLWADRGFVPPPRGIFANIPHLKEHYIRNILSHVSTLAVGAFRIFGVKREKLCKNHWK